MQFFSLVFYLFNMKYKAHVSFTSTLAISWASGSGKENQLWLLCLFHQIMEMSHFATDWCKKPLTSSGTAKMRQFLLLFIYEQQQSSPRFTELEQTH